MSRIFVPGDAYATSFTTSASTGAAANADSLPTVAILRNGAIDGAVTVTVTNIATGLYKAAATIPSSYADGDVVECVATATMGGIVTKAKVDAIRLQGGHLDVSVGSRPTSSAIANALLDLADAIESGLTLRQWFRLAAAPLMNKSGNNGNTFRDFNDTKPRLTATVDALGNRTAITRDAS
jgi:hypothetical protein